MDGPFRVPDFRLNHQQARIMFAAGKSRSAGRFFRFDERLVETARRLCAQDVREHLQARATTGTLKLVGIPLYGLLRTRSLSGAVLVALCANLLNQLDTRPGRALKAYLAAALLVDAPLGLAVLLAPYDLREMTMLGDAGSNGLGALLGLSSVNRFTGRGRWAAIGALAGLTVLGEKRSLGELIERTPILRELDAFGKRP